MPNENTFLAQDASGEADLDLTEKMLQHLSLGEYPQFAALFGDTSILDVEAQEAIPFSFDELPRFVASTKAVVKTVTGEEQSD